MSWHYLQGVEEVSSEENSSVGIPFVPSRLTPIAGASSSRDNAEAYSDGFQSGTMLKHSTASHGADGLTSLAEGFPVKISAQPEREPGSTERKAAFGLTSLGSLAKYNPVSRLWKTPQYSLLGDSDVYSGTWPAWGLMQDGECWERTIPALRISANAFGSLLPTPTASEYGTRNNGQRGDGSTFATAGAPSLSIMARRAMWPTVRASDGERGGRGDLIQAIRGNENKHYKLWPTPQAYSKGSSSSAPGLTPLDLAVRPEMERHRERAIERRKEAAQRRRWSTPTAGDSESSGSRNGTSSRANYGISLTDAVRGDGGAGRLPTPIASGPLNPSWVEWLMGWPVDWTDLESPVDFAKWESLVTAGQWWTEEPAGLSRTAKTKNRPARLRAIGNGQVPLTAALAYCILTRDYL